jgi:hypothetical protein
VLAEQLAVDFADCVEVFPGGGERLLEFERAPLGLLEALR